MVRRTPVTGMGPQQRLEGTGAARLGYAGRVPRRAAGGWSRRAVGLPGERQARRPRRRAGLRAPSSPTSPTRISMERFRAVDLVVTAKPDFTPVTEADQAIERASASWWPSSARDTPSSARSSAAMSATAGLALGRRPHRRHQELRARHRDLGDADRAAGRGPHRWWRWPRCRRTGIGYAAVRGGGAAANGAADPCVAVAAIEPTRCWPTARSPASSASGMDEELLDADAALLGGARPGQHPSRTWLVARGSADIGWTALNGVARRREGRVRFQYKVGRTRSNDPFGAGIDDTTRE